MPVFGSNGWTREALSKIFTFKSGVFFRRWICDLNKKNEMQYQHSFHTQSFPIPAIRQSHYKTKRKEIIKKIIREDDKNAINISISDGC